MLTGIIISGLSIKPVQAFVFGSEGKVIQWIKEGTNIIRLRNETNNVRVGGSTNPVLFINTASSTVGIGMTNPQNKLDVAGGQVIGINYAGINAPDNGLLVEGKVGIGTGSPSAQFVISNGISNYFTTDETNKRIQIGASVNNIPTETLEITGNLNFQSVIKPTSAQGDNITLTENAGAGTFVAGQYYYDFAFITADGHTATIEQPAHQPYITVADNSAVVIDNIPISPDPRVVGRRIFRTVTDGDWYRCYAIYDLDNNVDTGWVDDYSHTTDYSVGNYNYPDTTASTIKKDGVNLINFPGLSIFAGLSAGENTIGVGNVGIGSYALQENGAGYKNTAMGGYAISKSIKGNFNVGIGEEALANDNNPYYNTVLGTLAMRYTFGDSNVVIGYKSAQGTSGSSSGNNNIMIGYQAGDNILSGANNNILIGYDIDLPSATDDSQLSIGNLIFANGGFGTGTIIGTGNVGIGTTNPNAELQVAGRITEQGTFAEIYILNNSTAQSIPAGTTYTKIDQFTANGLSSNATADYVNNKIILTKAGKYKVSGTISMSSDTNNVVFDLAAFLNGTIQPQLHLKRKVATAGDVGDTMISGFIEAAANDELDIRVITDNAGAVGLTISYGNLNVEYIGE